MRIIIAGSRGFTDYPRLRRCVDEFIADHPTDDVVIVSGGARGADRLGEQYAHERGYKLRIMRADWDRFGKSAGYRRNEQMALIADVLIAFWDGQSRGTRHMIDLAKTHDLDYVLIERCDRD